MADSKHVEWLEEGIASWNRRYQHRDFLPDFKKHAFNELDLNGGQSGVILENAQFQEALLIEANLCGAKLNNANFDKAYLLKAKLENTDARGACFTDANLCGATFKNAQLGHADLTNANLYEANLKNTDLVRAKLHGADMTDTKPWRAKLYPDRKSTTEHTPQPSQIESIGCLLSAFKNIKQHHKQEEFEGTYLDESPLFYFRGERNNSWELQPSIMRKDNSRTKEKEREMLLDLMAQRPDDFNQTPPSRNGFLRNTMA